MLYVRIRAGVLALAVSVFLPFAAVAEIITGPRPFSQDSPGAFYFDVPPGFQKTGSDSGGLSVSYANTLVPVQFIIRVTPGNPGFGSADTEGTLASLMTRLNARSDLETIRWYNHSLTVSSFSFSPPVDPAFRTVPRAASGAAGWGISCELAARAGIVTAIAYAAEDALAADYDGVTSMILSCLDSLVINQETRYSPGPITTFAWPKTVQRQYRVSMDGRTFPVTLDGDDIEAAQSVIEREYSVLLYYQGVASLYQSAWQRYYSQIFRDSAGRLRPAAEAILDALGTDEEGTLRILLRYVQNLRYERNVGRSDFAPLPAIFAGSPSDCDSRSMFLAAVMHHAGSKTALFINERYAHAWFGLQSPLPGVHKAVPKIGEYLLCETVAQVTPGMVSRDMYEDPGWLPVILSW